MYYFSTLIDQKSLLGSLQKGVTAAEKSEKQECKDKMELMKLQQNLLKTMCDADKQSTAQAHKLELLQTRGEQVILAHSAKLTSSLTAKAAAKMDAQMQRAANFSFYAGGYGSVGGGSQMMMQQQPPMGMMPQPPQMGMMPHQYQQQQTMMPHQYQHQTMMQQQPPMGMMPQPQTQMAMMPHQYQQQMSMMPHQYQHQTMMPRTQIVMMQQQPQPQTMMLHQYQDVESQAPAAPTTLPVTTLPVAQAPADPTTVLALDPSVGAAEADGN